MLNLNFTVGDMVDVTPNKFVGYVIGFKNDNIVSVRDQNDDIFDIKLSQCTSI